MKVYFVVFEENNSLSVTLCNLHGAGGTRNLNSKFVSKVFLAHGGIPLKLSDEMQPPVYLHC